VPYKGAAQVVTDILGGQVVMPLASAGFLRPIAVTSLRRPAALPELPTVAESGYPGFEAWWPRQHARCGRGAPEHGSGSGAATARDGGKARPRFSEPPPSPPERFAEFLEAEHAKWGALIREAGIKLE
jgi:tripartite-type tricarboxylate transporter receptor subunit TctC